MQSETTSMSAPVHAVVPKHSLDESKRLRVCRVCGEPDIPRQVTPGAINTFVLDYGAEYAHALCIGRPLTQVLAGFPSLVVDCVEGDGTIHVKPPVEVVVPRPRRHQRSGKKGSRLADGVVCVTRPGKWGNPFETAGEFRSLLEAILGISGQSEFHAVSLQQFAQVNTIARQLHELRGKDLACWCGLDHECHADVLIELANR